MARKSWWPEALPTQLAVMMNTAAKITGHQAALGLTNAQVQRIIELCNVFIDVYNYVEMERETAGSLTAWRDDYFYRPGGGVPLVPPAFSVFSPPGNASAGAVDEFKEMRDMIVNLPDFPVTIGEDLMWLGAEITPVPPVDVQPTVHVVPAMTGYLATVVVSAREGANVWEAWILNKGAAQWARLDRFEGKSADITFAPTTPGEPYQFQLRIQLRKDNANYGQPSTAVTVTVNP